MIGSHTVCRASHCGVLDGRIRHSSIHHDEPFDNLIQGNASPPNCITILIHYSDNAYVVCHVKAMICVTIHVSTYHMPDRTRPTNHSAGKTYSVSSLSTSVRALASTSRPENITWLFTRSTLLIWKSGFGSLRTAPELHLSYGPECLGQR